MIFDAAAMLHQNGHEVLVRELELTQQLVALAEHNDW
jgi:hypothetical protein